LRCLKGRRYQQGLFALSNFSGPVSGIDLVDLFIDSILDKSLKPQGNKARNFLKKARSQ
jgi:hypothetical protein